VGVQDGGPPGLPARLLLASASPRRRDLVTLLRLPWRAAPQNVDEERYLVTDPVVSALNVALAKARAALPDLSADEMALAADTVVVLDGALLGKPLDADGARAMLGALGGRTHTVATGVCLLSADEAAWGAVVTSRVHMRDYSPEAIDAYIDRGEPFDKAGGYAVQDSAFKPVTGIDGCSLTVVGLPLCAVARGLETQAFWSFQPPAGRLTPPCGYCHAGSRLVRIRE